MLYTRMEGMLKVSAAKGYRRLVLGAFGCGAYKLPVSDVARLFKQVMIEPEFAGKFRLIAFAILESSRYPDGLDGKFAPFYREFGAYNPEA